MRYLVWNVKDWIVCRLPFVVRSRDGYERAERNAFELGRDFERGENRKELSTVATMLSAIQESMTTGA